MENYFGVAKEMEISDNEIGAVHNIVMVVFAGKVKAQFREARVRSKKKLKRKKRNHNLLGRVLLSRSSRALRISLRFALQTMSSRLR